MDDRCLIKTLGLFLVKKSSGWTVNYLSTNIVLGDKVLSVTKKCVCTTNNQKKKTVILKLVV